MECGPALYQRTPRCREREIAMNKAGEIAPFTVALDIGTTKVCILIGRKNEHGKLDVLGYGKVESNGVLRGVV